MRTVEGYEGQEPAWCPGCGNFGILRTFTAALKELEIEPHQLTVVSGIGQAAKLPHYMRCNTFNGLHGRALPVATGIRLANRAMLVTVFTGDGDCYGEGGNHFLHAIRRNVDVKLFVHDNQIYGLTKGQASPTSEEGMPAKNFPYGVLQPAFNPVAVAVAMGCSFVARSFSGDPDHLKEMIKRAIGHRGFTLVDILQPCVTFNHVNTYKWYRERVYHLGPEHDPGDRGAAFRLSLEWGERIPLGVVYLHQRPLLEDINPVTEGEPVANRPVATPEQLNNTLDGFY